MNKQNHNPFEIYSFLFWDLFIFDIIKRKSNVNVLG